MSQQSQQPGGNRARFFATPNQITISTPTNNTVNTTTSHKNDSTSSSRPATSLAPDVDSGSLNGSQVVAFPKRNVLITDPTDSPRAASDNSDDEIIAQRTRTTETETLYKTKKERHGKLNISGLIKHKSSDTKSLEASTPQRGTIEEVLENEQLDARSPHYYSDHKLISKASSPSASTPFHFASPSNQLVSSKPPKSRQPVHPDSLVPEVFRNKQQPQSNILPDSNAAHIATRSTAVSCDQKIKGLTNAFNRKHSAAPRPAPPRFASPMQEFGGRRVSSPTTEFEASSMKKLAEDAMASQNDMHGFDMEHDEDVLEDGIYRMADQREATGIESHSHRDLHEKRGEKRLSGSDIEDLYAAHTSKRARTQAYDKIQFSSLHDGDSRMFSSSESRASRTDEQPSHTQFKKSPPLSRNTREDFSLAADPQLKFFLGQDADEYVATHMDQYDAAKKRWAECSRDEWERGADELIEKFTQVLDFVKDHVKRQVNLYASLHSKVDGHQKAREETAEMLKEAKTMLVTKTGVVVDKDLPTGQT